MSTCASFLLARAALASLPRPDPLESEAEVDGDASAARLADPRHAQRMAARDLDRGIRGAERAVAKMRVEVKRHLRNGDPAAARVACGGIVRAERTVVAAHRAKAHVVASPALAFAAAAAGAAAASPPPPPSGFAGDAAIRTLQATVAATNAALGRVGCLGTCDVGYGGGCDDDSDGDGDEVNAAVEAMLRQWLDEPPLLPPPIRRPDEPENAAAEMADLERRLAALKST